MPSLAAADVRCPECEIGFLTLTDDDRGVWCAVCSHRYSVVDGVIDLLPGEHKQRGAGQRLMEWGPIVRIYESRLWRRSPAIAAALGISFAREQELITGAAGLTGAEKLLDLACGPGIYTRYFAGRLRDGSVVGLDLSFPMLRYASRRAREERVENVLWIHGTALKLPFPKERFDAVNCCGALHLFPDVPKALSEVQRVLKPAGRFTLAAFRRGEGPVAAWRARARRRLYGMDAFSTADLESRLRAAGLYDVQFHHARRAWLVASARKINEEPAKAGA